MQDSTADRALADLGTLHGANLAAKYTCHSDNDAASVVLGEQLQSPEAHKESLVKAKLPWNWLDLIARVCAILVALDLQFRDCVFQI